MSVVMVSVTYLLVISELLIEKRKMMQENE